MNRLYAYVVCFLSSLILGLPHTCQILCFPYSQISRLTLGPVLCLSGLDGLGICVASALVVNIVLSVIVGRAGC